MTSHGHDLATGYDPECAACKEFVAVATADTAVMIDCAVNPEFRIVRETCEDLGRHLQRMEKIARNWDPWLSGQFAIDFAARLQSLKDILFRINQKYPRSPSGRKTAVIEFLLSVYCSEFQCEPPRLHFSYMKKGNRLDKKAPGNEATTLFFKILTEAQREAKRIVDARADPPSTARDPKELDFRSDFGETARAIIERWQSDHRIPKPTELFALQGDLDAWSR